MLGGWCLAAAGLPLPGGPVTVVERPAAVVDGRLRVDDVVAWARHAERIVAIAPSGDAHLAVSLRPDQCRRDAGRQPRRRGA